MKRRARIVIVVETELPIVMLKAEVVATIERYLLSGEEIVYVGTDQGPELQEIKEEIR